MKIQIWRDVYIRRLQYLFQRLAWWASSRDKRQFCVATIFILFARRSPFLANGLWSSLIGENRKKPIKNCPQSHKRPNKTTLGASMLKGNRHCRYPISLKRSAGWTCSSHWPHWLKYTSAVDVQKFRISNCAITGGARRKGDEDDPISQRSSGERFLWFYLSKRNI